MIYTSWDLMWSSHIFAIGVCVDLPWTIQFSRSLLYIVEQIQFRQIRKKNLHFEDYRTVYILKGNESRSYFRNSIISFPIKLYGTQMFAKSNLWTCFLLNKMLAFGILVTSAVHRLLARNCNFLAMHFEYI